MTNSPVLDGTLPQIRKALVGGASSASKCPREDVLLVPMGFFMFVPQPRLGNTFQVTADHLSLPSKKLALFKNQCEGY